MMYGMIGRGGKNRCKDDGLRPTDGEGGRTSNGPEDHFKWRGKGGARWIRGKSKGAKNPRRAGTKIFKRK